MNEKELSLHIGFRLLSFRITQRLTRKELAAALGVSYSGISRLERGFTHRLSAIFLNNCHVKFGLSVDWLLTGQGPMVLPMAKFKMSPPKLRHQKGGKRRLGRVSALADQREIGSYRLGYPYHLLPFFYFFLRKIQINWGLLRQIP